MSYLERMKMKKARLITVITAALLIVSIAPYACLAYSGGSGTAEAPYQIANVADFQQLSATSADWSKSFVLTANINLTGLTFTPEGVAPNIQFALTGTVPSTLGANAETIFYSITATDDSQFDGKTTASEWNLRRSHFEFEKRPDE